MKILIRTILIFSLITFMCISCKNTNEPDENAYFKKTINVKTPGSLSVILTANELKSIKKLTITGNIDTRDFKIIRDNMTKLDTLDLSTVTIAAYKGTEGTSDETNHEYKANEIPSDAIPLSCFHIILPNSITSIDSYAFNCCYNLKKVIIPKSVSYIGDLAFSHCSSLDSVSIPNSVITIGINAFEKCSNLLRIDVGIGVISFGNDAFLDCVRLSEINVLPDNANFSSNAGVLFNKNQTELIICPNGKKGNYSTPNTVKTIHSSAFSNCDLLTNVTIGNSVTKIGNSAFLDCEELVSISIGNGVVSIGYQTFYNCQKLISANIGNSVMSIGFETFYNCIELKEITLPNVLSSIESGLFENCNKLKIATIGSGVTQINGNAFMGCKELNSLSLLSKNPISFSYSSGIFDNTIYLTCNLYVPMGTKPAYQKANLWKEFNNIVEM